MPQQTIDRIVDFFERFNSNTGVFNPTSVAVDAMYAEAVAAMADFLGTGDPGEVLLGANMTTLTYQLSRSLAHQFAPPLCKCTLTALQADGEANGFGSVNIPHAD